MTGILQRFARAALTSAAVASVASLAFERNLLAQAPSSTLPIVTSASAPFYPDEAMAYGVYGVVHAKVVTDGTVVVDVTVLDGPQLLRQATVENLRTWRFRPFIRTEFVVEFEYTMTYAPECSTEQNAVVIMDLPTKVHITKPKRYACVFSTPGRARAADSDGENWLTYEERQHIPTLVGFAECLAVSSGARSPVELDWTSTARQITTRLKSHVAEQQRPVIDIVKEEVNREIERRKSVPLSTATRPAFRDGKYWDSLDESERMGYASGFIGCERLHPGGYAHFDHLADLYAVWISEWFAVGTITEKRDDALFSQRSNSTIVSVFLGLKDKWAW